MNRPAPTMREVMTAAPTAIDAAATLSEAEALMASLDVHHLPVMESGDVISVVSDRELLRMTSPARAQDGEGLVVRDVCQHPALAADVDDPLVKVLDVMVQRHLSSVLVMADGDLAGIFTATDACRVLSMLLQTDA